MKAIEVDKQDATVIGGNVGETSQFSVKIDGHIFKTLIDGMYSAKVPSVVREILANAFDAHIEAGNPDPVHVSLPTPFNCNFRVRDYGVGMSHEFVMKLYTQLGHSEKRDTNDQTGMFGLGSKSPFSITDQFQITVFDGSSKRVYSAYINDDGIPCLTNPVNMPSDEPRGVEVLVPVQQHHVSEFETAVKTNGFAYFDKPITFNRDFGNGEQPLEWAKRQVSKLSDRLYCAADDGERTYYSHRQGDLYIRQGFAVYPLELEQLGKNDGRLDRIDQRLLEQLTKKRTDVMLDVPLGTFNMTASREKIQYDHASINNILDAIRLSLSDMCDQLKREAADCWNFRDFFWQTVRKEIKLDPQFDLKAVHGGAYDRLSLVKDMIELNWNDYADKHDLQDDLTDVTAYHRSPANNIKIFEEWLPAGARVYHANMGVWRDADQKICTSGCFTRNDGSQVDFADLVFIVPNGMRHWQERVAYTVSRLNWKGIGSSSHRQDVHIVRCKKMDVDLVKEAIEKHDRYCIKPLFMPETIKELPADMLPSKVGITRDRNRSRTAVFQAGGNKRHWMSEKVEAEMDEIAYFVERERTTRSLSFLSPAQRSSFEARYTYENELVEGAICKYEALGVIDEYRFFRIFNDACAAGLLDDTIPLYRVSSKQAEAIREKHPEWLEVGPTLLKEIPGAQKAIFDAAKAGSNLLKKTDADVLGKFIHDVILLGDQVDQNKATISISPRTHWDCYIEKSKILGDHLDTLNELIDNDAFALALAPWFLNHAASAKTSNELAAAAAQKESLISMMFRSSPCKDSLKSSGKFDALTNTLCDGFVLLRSLNYHHKADGEHIMLYLKAVLDSGSLSGIKLADYPEAKPVVTELCDLIKNVVKTGKKLQIAAATQTTGE